MSDSSQMGITFALALLAAAAQPVAEVDRDHEGDWAVADTTDNNTGERSVYAFQMHIERGDPDFVTLYLRCVAGRPVIAVDWTGTSFPDQAVISIAPLSDEPEADGADYVFQKSSEPTESGMQASPSTSAQIISKLGGSSVAAISAHLTYGTKTVTMNISGTQRAWNRVVRHCPVQKVPLPPI